MWRLFKYLSIKFTEFVANFVFVANSVNLLGMNAILNECNKEQSVDKVFAVLRKKNQWKKMYYRFSYSEIVCFRSASMVFQQPFYTNLYTFLKINFCNVEKALWTLCILYPDVRERSCDCVFQLRFSTLNWFVFRMHKCKIAKCGFCEAMYMANAV